MAKAKKKAATPVKKKAPAKGAKKAAPAASAAKTSEVLLVGSKVRAEIKGKGCNTGGDAIDGLNFWVHWLIDQGTKRAGSNGRKTVRAHDFVIM